MRIWPVFLQVCLMRWRSTVPTCSRPGSWVQRTAIFLLGEKTITTGLCPGGRLRMERLLRVLEMKRVDPTLMTTHTFPFDEMERAFEIMDKKLDGVLKPLIVF